jgi:hypothetical protein
MSGRALSPAQIALQGAIWSIYYHAFFNAGFSAPAIDKEGLNTTRLADALGIVLEAHDDRAKLRRIRALARLAAANMIRADRLDQFVEPGGGALVHAYIQRLASSLNLDLAPLEALPPIEAAAIVLALEGIPGCGPEDTQCQSTFDPNSMITTVVASGKVRRTLSQLKTSLDPRNWDICGGNVFNDTHRVSVDASSTDPAHPGYADDSNPPMPGIPWLLYEDVLAGIARYRNVLQINYQEDAVARSIQWTYDFVVNFETSLYGMPAVGKLEVDFGFVSAQAIDTHWSVVTVKKSVRFTDELMNLLVAPTLTLWLEDTTSMPCC